MVSMGLVCAWTGRTCETLEERPTANTPAQAIAVRENPERDRVYKILRDGRPKKPKVLGSRQVHLEETRTPPAKRRHSPAPPRAPKAAKPTSSTATQSESSLGSATTEEDVERIARAVAVLMKK
ncbi:unnamed protein product [Cylicocyclus nassatus]|uniref:Uncharacterized protein n=1 Tax=Cylicocyclus nassatus TaxID=53992 RepID=A0AA36GGE2_CYLNA|nr:unnamed protein product [Cylicocyclus nassatus]